jgi:hypothetical protein
MGQAAGTAAALALETGVSGVRDISIPDLRTILAADGIELDPDKHKPFALHDTRLDSNELNPKNETDKT